MTQIKNKFNHACPQCLKHSFCRRGFTIIETMVSVSIFIIITTVGMSTLLNANLVYQKSHDIRSSLDSLNFVMEDMSRSIRTGYKYNCFDANESISSSISVSPKSCAKGWAIAFESPYGSTANANDQSLYYINNDGQIFKATQGPYNDSSFTQMTPDEVVIDPNLSYFVVTGAESSPTDKIQPLVTIRLVGNIVYHGIASPFSLQTSVSQRLVDL
jgi:type II secretory pathway pseudopilin PulG